MSWGMEGTVGRQWLFFWTAWFLAPNGKVFEISATKGFETKTEAENHLYECMENGVLCDNGVPAGSTLVKAWSDLKEVQ